VVDMGNDRKIPDVFHGVRLSHCSLYPIPGLNRKQFTLDNGHRVYSNRTPRCFVRCENILCLPQDNFCEVRESRSHTEA
jgi:hypothetical protein